jgi:hypothetical protein
VAADGVLSTVEARDRRYTVKTPHYAGINGSRDHIQVYIDATYSTGTWQIKVHTDQESSGTLTIAASGLYDAGTYELDDSTDTNEIRIEYVTSASANNYAEGIFVVPFRAVTTLPTGAFANGAADVVASDITQLADEAPASTFALHQMHDMVQNIYERRTGMCYASALEYDLTAAAPSPGAGLGGGVRTMWAIVNLYAPHGCAGWTVYMYVSAQAGGTEDMVWLDIHNADNATITGMTASAWLTFNIAAPTDGAAIPPRRTIALAGQNFTLQSLCIFCQDAGY